MIGLRIIGVALTLALAACGALGPDRIDGTSAESYDASIAKIREGLPAPEQARFDASLVMIATSAFAQSDSRAEMQAKLRAELNGKTAGDVIAEADTRRRNIPNAAVDSVFKLKKQMKAKIEDMKDEGMAK